MNDKIQLAAMGEHMAEQAAQPMCMAKRIEELEAQVKNLTNRLAWRNTGSPNGLRRFMTQKQYDAQTPGVQKWYEPIRYEVPEGWQLVPVEPTENMIGHGCGASVMVVSEVIKAWAAMLAAAPKPECCRPVAMTDMRFVVCPDCGNKRCPRANDHRNACTGSNELGQEGSAYPAAPKQQGGEPCAIEPPSSSPD